MADLDFMYASERNVAAPNDESPEDYCRRNNFPPPQADPTAWSLPVNGTNNKRGADMPFPVRGGGGGGVVDEGPLIRILIAVIVLCVVLCGVLVYMAEDPVWSASMSGGATAADVAGDAPSSA